MKKLEENEWFRCGLLLVPRLRFGLPAGVVANVERRALDPLGPPSEGEELAARFLRAMSIYGNLRRKLHYCRPEAGATYSVPSTAYQVRNRFAAQGEHLWENSRKMNGSGADFYGFLAYASGYQLP